MSISRTGLTRLLLCLACLLLVVGATAAEKPKALQDLEALRKLVVQKKWKDAVEGFGRLFDEHTGDPELVRRVRDIEDDFKRALFMLDYGKPSGKDLFGPQVKYWGLSSLKVELVCGSTLSGPAWTRLKGGARLLDLRFRDKVTVKMAPSTTGRMLLCYDLEKEGGYLVQLPGFVVRLDSAGEEVIGRPNQRALRKAKGDYKISRDSYSIKVHKGGVQITRASDKTYKGGYLAFLGRFQGLVIEGRLDKDFYHQLAGSREDKAFREWQEKSYKREELLPEWLRKGVVTSAGPALAELPSDATKGLAEDVGEHLEKALEGEEKSAKALRRFAKSQFGEKTRIYLEAVAVIGDGEIREGEEKLTEVLEKEPGFGPALALRGLVRISLRKLDDARTDLAAARKASPKLHWTYIGLVRIAIYEGDLDAASRAVVESQKAGAHSPDMERLGKLVHRARRGPLWGTRHHYSSKNFEISSDHSKDL
ncbi:MAG: tetratricopeptide repeat protein, partial [Planctomycetota bacterium]